MASLSTERLRKQDTLLLEVKCNGINPYAFLGYIKSIKGDDFNHLDAWEFKELQIAIDGYQQSLTDKKDAPQNTNIQDSSRLILKSDTSGNILFHQDMQDQFYRKIIPCNETVTNSLVSFFELNPSKSLQAKITESKINDAQKFTSKFVIFNVHMSEFGWSVWRRYNDFLWLRNMLVLQFPHTLIPPVPKKTLLRKFTPKHISKRLRMFEMFLTTIINTPLLRTSQIVVDFLSTSDEQELIAIQRKSGESLSFPKKFEDYTNLDRQVVLEINPFLNKYYQNITQYLVNTDELYEKTTQNSRLLFQGLSDVQDKIMALGDNLKSMRQLTEHFNGNNIIGNLGILPCTYTILESFMTIWSKNINDLMQTFKGNFYEFFRFQKGMQEECIQLVSQRNKMEDNFIKSQQVMDSKKEKYFNNIPVDKWEIIGDYDKILLQGDKKMAFSRMLQSEQMATNLLRDDFAFLNKQLIENFTLHFDIKGTVYTNRFMETLKKQVDDNDIFKNNLQILSRQLNHIGELRVGRECGSLSHDWIERYMSTLSISYIIGAVS